MKHKGGKSELSLCNLTHSIIFPNVFKVLRVWIMPQTHCRPYWFHNHCTRKRLPTDLKYSEVSHPWLLLYHCVPTVILVSQQWHLNVPTSVTQRKRGVAYVNSLRFSLKLHNNPALRVCSSLWYTLELPAETTRKSRITAQPGQCGHQDATHAGELTSSKMVLYKEVKLLPKGKVSKKVHVLHFSSHSLHVPSFTSGGSLAWILSPTLL